jgi:nucleoside-diphosphate-sugar epimerase
MSAQRIFIAGHNGMVGSAILRLLSDQPQTEIITRTKTELNLIDQQAVKNFFHTVKPDQVYLAAARVGGIAANNNFPADFIYQNLMIEANVIHAAFEAGVRRLMFLGSSCIYPKMADQPMREEALLTGTLEATNEPYAIAKIAGIKMCESYNRQHGTDYRSIMPTNLYGPGDNYHPEHSHVIPAMIRRFHQAKTEGRSSVTIWGTGTPRREFLYVDDMAAASIFLMNLPKEKLASVTSPMNSHINAGSGTDLTILELAREIAQATGYTGEILCDTSRPDGTPRKLMDSSRLTSLGWKPTVDIREGLTHTYNDFINNLPRYTG